MEIYIFDVSEVKATIRVLSASKQKTKTLGATLFSILNANN